LEILGVELELRWHDGLQIAFLDLVRRQTRQELLLVAARNYVEAGYFEVSSIAGMNLAFWWAASVLAIGRHEITIVSL